MREISRELQKIPVLRILVPFILGILSAMKWEGIISEVQFTIPLILLIIFSRLFFSDQDRLFKMFMFLFFYLAGLVVCILNKKEVPDFQDSERVMVIGEIVSSPVFRNGRYRCEIETKHVIAQEYAFKGKTILLTYIADEAIIKNPDPCETFHLTGKIYTIRNDGNPGEFDYAGYLSGRNCFYRFYPDSVIRTDKEQLSLLNMTHLAGRVKNRITSTWSGGGDGLAGLMAVTMGDKSELTGEMKETYSDAGGMHILAVSGLHVGLIWMILERIFLFLTFIPGGKRIRSVLIIIILWFYAAIAGFSPSVCRSVTMFSLLSVSSAFSRDRNSVNIVLLSALILLMVNPAQIIEVGFQLSYLAVIGIITIQPLLAGLFRTRYRIIRWMVDLSSVSVAAQIATLPLSVFYFHQIPIYFLITNLAAIPLLSCIVGIFVISTPFFLAQCLEKPFLWILANLTQLMNRIMEIVSSVPGSTVNGLQMPVSEVILVYLLIFFLLLSWKYHRILYMMIVIILLSGLFLHSSMLLTKDRRMHRMIVPHFRGGTLISFVHGRDATHFISYDDSLPGATIHNYINSNYAFRNMTSAGFRIDSLKGFQNRYISAVRLFEGCLLIVDGNIRVLVVDGSFNLSRPCFFADYRADAVILHRYKYYKSVDSLCFSPGTEIIINGFNRATAAERFVKGSSALHITERDGAYIKNY